MDLRTPFGANRDRLASRLAELARMLANPTPQAVSTVKGELERLSRG